MSVRVLRPGRSIRSYLLLAGDDTHLFVFAPRLGSDSYGLTLRRRVGRDWRHWRLVLGQRNSRPMTRENGKRVGERFAVRRTLTLLELSTWRTRRGTYERDDIKAYVRVKLSAGGRRLEDVQ